MLKYQISLEPFVPFTERSSFGKVQHENGFKGDHFDVNDSDKDRSNALIHDDQR